MPRLTPVDWRRRVSERLREEPAASKVFEAAGFVQERSAGSHLILGKPGVARPIVIPRYPTIRADIILANLRTAGMSRERYLELLASVK